MSRWASDATRKPERAPRFAIPMSLRYRRRGEAAWHEGTIENISRTGVLFSAEKLMDLRDTVEMTFQLPVEVGGENAAQVICVGKVVRTVLPPASDQPSALAASIRSYKFIPKVEDA